MTEQDEKLYAVRFLRRYVRVLQQLEAKKKLICEKVSQNLRLSREDKLLEAVHEFTRIQRTIKFLKQLLPIKTGEERTFVFSSLLLRDSFKLSCEIPDKEGMHFIVGIEHEGLLIGTRIVPFPYSHRSVVGAGGDHRSTHKISIEMFEANHAIIAVMHSHPGCGLNANRHSGTDLETQKRWEQGWPLISGIWTRDGYLRFFSWQLAFVVETVGSHIEEVKGEKHAFKLAQT